MASQFPDFLSKFLELTDRPNHAVRLNVGFSNGKRKDEGVEPLSRFVKVFKVAYCL